MQARWLSHGNPATIRSRIRWIVLACVVPAWLLAVAVSYVSYERERDAIASATVQTARSMVQSVEREFAISVTLLQALATSTRIDEGDLRRFREHAAQALKSSPGTNIRLIGPDLRVLMSVDAPLGESLPRLPDDRFASVMRNGEPTVSDYFLGDGSPQGQVAVAVPVMRGGVAIGRLELAFSVARFSQLLEQQSLPVGWTVAVLDRQGVIVARNRSPTLYVGKVAGASLIDELRRRSEGSFSGQTSDGVDVIGCFSRSSAYGWSVAIGVPKAVLHARLQRTLLVYAAGALILLAIGLFLADRIGRHIAEPIQALVGPALAIGRGEDAQISVSAVREVTELGQALVQAQRLLNERQVARKEAETALLDSQSRLRMALDASQIGDWDIDLRTNVIHHSFRHDQCFGYTEPATDWNANSFIEHVHPDDREWVSAGMHKLLRSGASAQMDCRVLWPDGSTHWIAARTNFLREGGVPYLMTGIVIDITERKQNEELRLSAVKLAAENQKILEANRLKSEFLANMSHELRTPLNAVIGFAELMHNNIMGLSADKQKEYLGHIVSSGQHLLRLINDVLDLSKVESGKFEFFPEPVDLPELITDVMRVLQPEADVKGISLAAEHDPGLTGVVFDPGRLRQMLYNLLSNAVKFTGREGRVVLRTLAQGSTQFRIEVEDSGVGISQEDQQKLFTQFQQVQSGYARAHQGTGLGLALVRRFAELQGGYVGVRSTPGVGSVFHLVLPRQPMPRAALV